MGKRTSLVAGCLFLTLAAGNAVTAAAGSSDLGFAQRLRAQEAIERFYYSHQTGATRPFEQVFTRERLERKVRTYLEQSVALEQIWGIPVTAEMLRNEVERMARQTRLPQRLLELYAVLDYDPVLVQECLVRPALVDRLIRDRFAFDDSIHAEPRRQAEALRQRLLNGSIDPFTEQPERTVVILARSSDVRRAAATPFADTGRVVLDADEFDRWAERVSDAAGGIGKLVETRTGFHVRVVLERDVERIELATFSVAKTPWDDWWNDTRAELVGNSVEPVALDAAPLPVPSASGEAQGVPTSACEPGS